MTLCLRRPWQSGSCHRTCFTHHNQKTKTRSSASHRPSPELRVLVPTPCSPRGNFNYHHHSTNEKSQVQGGSRVGSQRERFVSRTRSRKRRSFSSQNEGARTGVPTHRPRWGFWNPNLPLSARPRADRWGPRRERGQTCPAELCTDWVQAGFSCLTALTGPGPVVGKRPGPASASRLHPLEDAQLRSPSESREMWTVHCRPRRWPRAPASTRHPWAGSPEAPPGRLRDLGPISQLRS